MTQILEALLPIFLLILIGYTFKKIKFPSEDFWPMADRFTYYVLMPALLIYKLSNANLNEVDGLFFVLSGIVSLLIISIIAIVLNRITTFEGKSFTSVFQGSVRFNTYVFLALIDAILGDVGLVLAAFLITFAIPFINLLCISIFSIYASSSKITVYSFIKSIIKNPLILACFIGGMINFFNVYIPIPLEKTISILSVAALPLGLLSVGVGLELSNIKTAKLELIIAVFFKLIILPLIMFLICTLLKVEGTALFVLLIFASMPTASSSYILARELGGDIKLMSSIITVQTMLSIVTISILLQVVKL